MVYVGLKISSVTDRVGSAVAMNDESYEFRESVQRNIWISNVKLKFRKSRLYIHAYIGVCRCMCVCLWLFRY